ncbi:MAG: N-formylglutamate amidohydrolase [Rhodospirillaceae bacterium]|nr:N-formylglutamate amidohydrolase [Rhodospirillaceae bacterium]|tara:strand:- start:358 stop:1134 length:777 start_codon:yes stop_codon:yes gene_type:complete
MTLLGLNDPPAVSEFNTEGNANLLLTSDHNGCTIPDKLNDLGVPKHELRRHVAYDIGIDGVAQSLAERFDAPLVVSNYSRLVVDCNRRPGTAASIPVVSDRTKVTGNENLKRSDKKSREFEIFYPYHNAIEKRIRQMRQKSKVSRGPILIALHSFTPVMNGVFRPWQIGVLWKDNDELARPLIEALRSDSSLCIGDNQPYSGSEPAGYTFEEHVLNHDLISVAIEFRQDLVEFQSGAEYWADVFATCLETVLSQYNFY